MPYTLYWDIPNINSPRPTNFLASSSFVNDQSDQQHLMLSIRWFFAIIALAIIPAFPNTPLNPAMIKICADVLSEDNFNRSMTENATDA